MSNREKKYTIELKDMEFFAHHGCFSEEQIIGNNFVVNLSVVGDFSVAERSDDIDNALNYQTLYDIVSLQMKQTSKLLENVAGRIVDAIRNRFQEVEYIKVTIDKINPPLGGKLYASSVTLEYPNR